MNTRMGITTSLVVSLLLLAIIACAETAPSPTPARTEAAVGMQPTQEPTTSSQLTANDRQSPGVGPIPAPPPSPPILGEKVSLDEARRRTPYTIPIPPDGVVGADIQEVWASEEGAPTEFRQVYLIYANGLKISIGGRPDAIDYSALADDPFRAANVRGIPASGKDPAVKTLSTGGQVNTPANLSWWVNQVDIGLYHPTWFMEQLLEIGEAMPDPIWSPTTTRALPTFTPVPNVGVATPTIASVAQPPPLPQVSLEHGGRSYQGWRGSYCWPVSANSRVCADSVGWQGFDKVSAVLMKRGDAFSIRISGSDPASDEFRVRASIPQETRLAVKPGEELFSSDSLEGLRLDLPAGVYFVSTFYESQLGDVSFGFKVEIVD